ncbi:uncharacterized protein LOC134666871 [Cydia fagiglandana]|uniref:uncharacterized protein LOC134666871 n=1 Tax=Cydia fagiglandana TaxID=1458189 RepID=UPI002FEDED24
MSRTSASSETAGRLPLVLRKNRIISMSSESSDDDIPPIIVRRRHRPIVSNNDDNDGLNTSTREGTKRKQVVADEDAHSNSKRRKSGGSGSTVNVKDLIEALNSRSKPSISSHQMLNALPEFDPDNKSQNIEIWLHKVNEYARIYEWDDVQTSHYATQKLVGTAKKWLYSLPSLNFTWPDWQVKLRRAFPIDDNFALMLEEMFARKTKADESLRTYFYDKLMLLNRCEITGKKAVDCLIHGISDVSMRNSAQALKCVEPEDLLQYFVIQQPEKAFSFTQKKRGYAEGMERRIFRKIRCFNCGVDGHTSNRCPQKKEIPNTKSSTCFNCKEEGHRFSNCPKTLMKCKACGMIGHNDQNCRFPSSKNATKTEKVLNIISSNSNEKFVKEIDVNNKSVHAYIDFGSDCSLMNSTEAENLKLDKIFSDLPAIKGFGNFLVTPMHKSKVTVQVDEVPLSEGSKHLSAFVTPDGHYEFNRMPFGLANAPAVFQKMIVKLSV